MNRIALCLFMAIKFVYFVLCHLGWGRVWTRVYDPPMTFTILSGRWVGNTGCPAKSSTKGGHPNSHTYITYMYILLIQCAWRRNVIFTVVYWSEHAQSVSYYSRVALSHCYLDLIRDPHFMVGWEVVLQKAYVNHMMKKKTEVLETEVQEWMKDQAREGWWWEDHSSMTALKEACCNRRDGDQDPENDAGVNHH
jgi:hypothetical protein